MLSIPINCTSACPFINHDNYDNWLFLNLKHIKAPYIWPGLLGGGNVKVNFNLSPDPPNIAEGDTAVFNCSSNHSLVTITWILNETESASTLTSLGVIVNGAATPVSSLIIPGLVDSFSETEVLCYASGPGFSNVSPSPVMLRVQGVPALVDNFNLSNDFRYFSWTPPFTLLGVPILRYNINVTKDTELIKQTHVNETKWEYCPQQFGNLSISVAAVNNAGEGKIFNYHLLVEKSMLF